jgi:hypothetical protein|tara:strand:- start:886 stop:1281 length:396 start_codon:yes stop_codon:yes gene_type:complete
MIKFFSKFKIVFYSINFILIFLYIFPGSLLGLILYNNKKIQPQITPDFVVSSNHFYVFLFISVIGFLSFIKSEKSKYLITYLIFISIFLEILHLVIPERSFQWSDLFGNLLGVMIVISIKNLINKYEIFKK